jgi:serine/threonine-protein kinase
VADRILAGRYRLRERIGAGGMGEVWKATDDVLGRTVAVKLVLPNLLDSPGFVRRFVAEARAMASVRHPGVVAIHDFHGDESGAYLVMEYVDGEPLSQLLARVGRLDPATAMDLVRQTAQALQAVHDRGIVHRDVKPANILVRPDGAVALTDFGIALADDNPNLTLSGAIIGTPSYLAPEQVLGHPASPLTDVYALGIVAYECLAGRRPFVGENPIAVAMQRLTQPPPPLDGVIPPTVGAVVERALAADPTHRWPSAVALALAAQQALAAAGGASPYASAQLAPPARGGPPLYASEAITVRHGPAAPTPAPPTQRGRRLVLAVAFLATIVAAGTVGYLALRNPSQPSSAGAPGSTAGPSGSPSTGSRTTSPPDGFITCDVGLCPTHPMCWHGLVTIGDIAHPPGSADCSQLHYWETFAVTYVPASAVSDYDLSHLISRPDMAAFCSPERMAARSKDPNATRGWRIEAWPIPANANVLLVHCIAGDPDRGETTGTVFPFGV